MVDIKKTLPQEIGLLARDLRLTISLAESATGGLISSLITDLPGSSDFFRGGVVAYDNEVKVRVLGVCEETLEKYGAVSSQTAEQMAAGVRKLMQASIGLSDTGIAGPTGATPGKPVGLFYLGLSSNNGTQIEKHQFAENRIDNKTSAALAVLGMLREHLLRLKG